MKFIVNEVALNQDTFFITLEVAESNDYKYTCLLGVMQDVYNTNSAYTDLPRWYQRVQHVVSATKPCTVCCSLPYVLLDTIPGQERYCQTMDTRKLLFTQARICMD